MGLRWGGRLCGADIVRERGKVRGSRGAAQFSGRDSCGSAGSLASEFWVVGDEAPEDRRGFWGQGGCKGSSSLVGVAGCS